MIFNIPYEDGTEFPARPYMPDSGIRGLDCIPLIVQTNGCESAGEELYSYGSFGTIPRGYAVPSFDRPGQWLWLRRDRTVLRPDWEHMTKTALNYVSDTLGPWTNEFDLDRIAIIGASMGCYFAL